MKFYETLYIVDSNLESKSLEKEMDDVGKELAKTNSKIINHRIWGKKRLAYAIQRQKYGSYIILQYEGGDLSKMPDFDTWMKLNNSVLRHMTVVLSEKPAVHVAEEKSEQADENIQQKDSEEHVEVENNKKLESASINKNELNADSDITQEESEDVKEEQESVSEED
tara:strand:+ start:655 stop:1155 length:501 start_codon:yes stop_codon:yes gene_type:complete